ncbi:DUF1697 domain-containing protein [Gilvimarinus sp. DZF01]|uniref:DUF1697 domain-containing protein n=1 Tax=Gilvimarinus sp. DZF01 TaxID=3461371 RepID=UPI0040451F25
MSRHVAFLRGVSPVNARMAELRRCFEEAGYERVRTVLSSGNVVFDSRSSRQGTLERRAVKAMEHGLGRSFGTMVRSVKYLEALIESEPFAEFNLPPQAKCVVTFLRGPLAAAPELPLERGSARILKICGSEAFTAYTPSANDPAFMQLIERTFGKDVTTRTLQTVRKCVLA